MTMRRRHLGALLAAPVVGATMLLASAPPASAVDTRLVLISLNCVGTEDWTGADESYLLACSSTASASGVRSP